MLSVHLHIDLFVGLLITIPAMFILGVVDPSWFIRPLRGRERTSMSLLACYAVAIIIEGVAVRDLRVEQPVTLNASYINASIKVFGFYLRYIYLYWASRWRWSWWRRSTSAVPDPVRPQRAGHHAGPRPRPGWSAST